LGTLLERTVALGFRPHKVDVTHDVLSVTNTTLPTLRAAVDPSTRGGDYYGPAYELFAAELEPELNRSHTPAERLAAMARAYVRFAGTHHALFQVLFEAGIDKGRHPEVAAAELPIDDAFHDSVRVLSDAAASEALASAVEAAAHGHAMLFLDERFGQGPDAVELAAERAAGATLTLVESRHLITRRQAPARA
jgi:Tetracyclin repressor-like, C-terminal domain